MKLNRKLGPEGRRVPVPVQASKELPIQAIDHYWHPDREGVERCDERFQRELDNMCDGRVVIVRPPAGAPLVQKHAWLIWLRKPSVTDWISPGWFMLIDWRVKGEPMELDSRVFSYLWSVSVVNHGSAKAYFDKCVLEMERDKAAKNKLHTDDMHARTKDYFDYTKVKSIGKGNKFALHDATSVPSRGTRNWLAENRKRMIPGEVLADEQQQAEKARAARG
jgi:hypothetical protein